MPRRTALDNASLGLVLSGLSWHEARAWVAAGLMVILLTAVTTWFRRSEIALYTALGTDRVRLVVANGLEAWALTLGGVVSGVLWGLALERLGGHIVTLDASCWRRGRWAQPRCSLWLSLRSRRC
ncbi:MAG: hypothetical protein ACRDHF_11285 [Tepidiformaceae bacterium]